MVFVSILLITSLIILLVLGVSDLVFFNAIPLYSNNLNNFFLNINSNVIYLYIIVFLLAFGTLPFVCLAIATFISFSYYNSFRLLMTKGESLEKLAAIPSDWSISRLSNEAFLATANSIYNFLTECATATLKDFNGLVSDSINDFNIVLGLHEPTWKDDTRWGEIYEMQNVFFNYNKIDLESMANPFKTDEEVINAWALWNRNSDPNEHFNFVSRFPWKFTYEEEFNLPFQFFVKNFLVVYNFFNSTLLAVILMIVYFIYTVFFFNIQFLKQLSVWFVIGMLYFWLMSGFNFFVNSYQFGKFTSQIQSFWNSTNTSFWLIEGFLLLIFFYYFLNSSQEPLYMYDYSAINQEYLVSLQIIGINVVLLSLVIYFMYFTLISINSNSWTQLNLYLVIISSFIFFSFFIETYQFYYVISTFNESLWVFNEDENMWGVDTDNPILSTKHQYLFVCLIANYWHFLFIFLSWVFFLINSFENSNVTYVLFGANLQNMIILYALNLACYLQWFNWVYSSFFDLPYTWFFTSIDNNFFFSLVFEVNLLIANITSFNGMTTNLNIVAYNSLSLWNVDSLCMWNFL